MPSSGVCQQAESDYDWPFSVAAGTDYSCRSPRGGVNDQGNTPHMCNGKPNSVRIQITHGEAECLRAHADQCKIPMRDFVSLDYDLNIDQCQGIWAAPVWMSPDKWQWDGDSGEIDSTEMCPRTGLHMNFAGGKHQVPTGFPTDVAELHITVRKDEAGIVTVKACTQETARENGNQCERPQYTSCGDCNGSDYACWCNGSDNIYGSGGCQAGGDCEWTIISDAWNGVGGDAGYSACMVEVEGVVGAGRPNYNSNCAFSVENLIVKGGGPGGALQWGAGSAENCRYLTV